MELHRVQDQLRVELSRVQESVRAEVAQRSAGPSGLGRPAWADVEERVALVEGRLRKCEGCLEGMLDRCGVTKQEARAPRRARLAA